jgi:hypothetical protein
VVSLGIVRPMVISGVRLHSRRCLGRRQGDKRGGLRFGAGALHFGVPFPNFVDRRVDDELEDERGKDAANHRRGHSLPHVGPGAVAHMIGINPTNIVATVMNFGRSRFAAPSAIVAWRSASAGRSPEATIGTVIRVAVNHQCGNVIARSSPFANGIAACLLASTVWIVLSRRWLVRSIPVLAQCPTPGRRR